MISDKETSEILKQVRAIEIHSKLLSKEIFSGEYHTAFKGRGMAFSEHREYRHGDEIRDIDWNVTARMRKPFIKLHHEEREITAMLVIDMSASESFGTRQRSKLALITELVAVLAFSASKNNDKVGAILFTDHVEKFIPPKKGRSHILRIIAEILQFKATGKGTEIGAALSHLNKVIKKRSITFLLSDFKSGSYEDELDLSSRKHDLVAIRVFDPLEEELPKLGIIHLNDLETGIQSWVNTNSRSTRQQWNEAAKEHALQTERTLRRCQVDHANLATNQDYIPALIKMFRHRA